jgi:hypothetical protein
MDCKTGAIVPEQRHLVLMATSLLTIISTLWELT